MTAQSGKAAVSPGMRTAVFMAQVDHLYQQLPRVLAYSALVMLLLALMLRDAVPESHIIGWLAAMVLVLLARTVLYFLYRYSRDVLPVSRWAHLFVMSSGISGLVWGMAGVVLFAPEQLELQALILLVLAGMGAGSAAVLPMYLPAFYAYFPISMIPAGVMMFLQADSFHVFMGIFDIVFMLGLMTFGRAVGEAFRSSLELRYENIELVNALENQRDELERVNLAKSKFLAAASHDLRQPMHALSLFSEVLDQQATDKNMRGLAGNIRSSVGALERLFAALLDISRLDAGVLSPEIEIFPVQDVIERVINDCLPDALEKQLDLRNEGCDVYTESDPTLLERILRNLVANAIRYTLSGSVTIRCKESTGGLILSVEDTGVGIAEDQQENIFEEFTQLGNPERDRTKGLGLGLSIVRRIASLLDHPLTLQSRPGYGATFTLQLPVREQSPTGQDETRHDPYLIDTSLNQAVLVIDDDPEVRTGTQLLLESWGCAVTCAATAEEALQIAASGRTYDALVADFRLPGNTRVTRLIGKLRELQGREVPALLVSGDTEPARLQEANECGLELLHKPVKPARLRAWLQKSQSV